MNEYIIIHDQSTLHVMQKPTHMFIDRCSFAFSQKFSLFPPQNTQFFCYLLLICHSLKSCTSVTSVQHFHEE